MTRLDHDANVSPWLELEHDLGIEIGFVDIDDECRLDLDDLERQLSERTKVVAFPVASNAVGTLVDVPRVAELAHSVGALAWADAVHYAPHGPIDVAAYGVDVLICSPYKFYGPHLGTAFARRELLKRWRPYKVRPAPEEPPGHRFETGTLPHELLAGYVAAVDYMSSIGWEAVQWHENELGERFLTGLPDTVELYGPRTMEGRVSTFAFNVRDQGRVRSPSGWARRTSPSGTGTTTRWRSCAGSGWSRKAQSAQGSSTTTQPRRSTGYWGRSSGYNGPWREFSPARSIARCQSDNEVPANQHNCYSVRSPKKAGLFKPLRQLHRVSVTAAKGRATHSAE